MSALRMLYFLGAGPAAAERVDTAHLFGEILGRQGGLQVDWYLRSADRGGPVMRRSYHGQPARVCGRAPLPGAVGRAASKVNEALAVLHFFWTALRGRYDLVQVRDDFVASPLGLLAARLAGSRFVFWLSYPFPEARMLDAREGNSRFRWYSMLAGWLSSQVLYRVVLPRADQVFVQSEQMKRDVLRPGIAADRITPVPMGLPDGDLPSLCPPVAAPVVLYVGTLARVRRLEMMVEAFGQVLTCVPEARLVVVGEGDRPEDRAALEREAKRLNIAHAVHFVGKVPREDALRWVQQAAVCLSPFYPTFVLRSTSPTKLIEYMAMGKAVVANDHPEQAAVIAQSGAGLCTPWSVSAFADAVVTLLLQPQQRLRAGQAGRAWVVQHRRYSSIAAAVMNHYRRLFPELA
jgi:glycosyltransferase involved in cell wall biosynthesis